MDYQTQIDQAKVASQKWRKENPIVGVGRLRVDLMVDDLIKSITDLLARAEAAEARAEKAERERDAAIKELDCVSSAVDDLSEFIDEQIHPLVPYDMYLALRENADAISMWQHESEWREKKEE